MLKMMIFMTMILMLMTMAMLILKIFIKTNLLRLGGTGRDVESSKLPGWNFSEYLKNLRIFFALKILQISNILSKIL